MKNRLVATAGHVDHGKTALLNALTGQETDRLDEEKERGLTIDLGFAHLAEGDLRVGFIDVPGHRNFIKNMVSGVGSVQGVLFVVSAVDGWEAQSREHFEIINLLRPEYCCFALTKIDLADEEMRLLVRAEIEDAVEGTPYENADVLPVSSETGEGIEDLKDTVTDDLRELDDPADHGKPYCPVDRVFSVKGQGTVVTGSLSGGPLSEGDTIHCLPGRGEGRVRGIQQYHESVDTAHPGSRVALNVPDWDHTEIERGTTMTRPDAGEESGAVDGLLEAPRNLSKPIRHDRELLAYRATDRRGVQVLLEDSGSLAEGESGLARLNWLEGTSFVRPGDRIILRDHSDRHLLGCLTVLNPEPIRTLSEDAYREWLRRRHPVTVRSLLESSLSLHGAMRLPELAEGTPYAESEYEEAASADGLRRVGEDWIVDEEWWSGTADRIRDRVRGHHEQQPLSEGLPVAEVRSELPEEALLDVMVEEELLEGLKRDGDVLRAEDFEPEMSAEQRAEAEDLREELRDAGLEAPDRDELESSHSPKLVRYLVRSGRIVELDEERLLDREVFEELRGSVESYLAEHERARLSDLRDHLDSSRKYVIPLMEYLDRDGLTVRDGDHRYLRDPGGTDRDG